MLQKGALSFQRWVQLSKVGDVQLFFHTKYLSPESAGCHHLSPPPSLSSLSVKVQSLCPANTERLLVPSSREELAWRSKGTARQFLKHRLPVGMAAELCTGGVPVCPHLPPNNVLPQHPGLQRCFLSPSFPPGSPSTFSDQILQKILALYFIALGWKVNYSVILQL